MEQLALPLDWALSAVGACSVAAASAIGGLALFIKNLLTEHRKERAASEAAFLASLDTITKRCDEHHKKAEKRHDELGKLLSNLGNRLAALYERDAKRPHSERAEDMERCL